MASLWRVDAAMVETVGLARVAGSAARGLTMALRVVCCDVVAAP